jgi:hypothetical protein
VFWKGAEACLPTGQLARQFHVGQPLHAVTPGKGNDMAEEATKKTESPLTPEMVPTIKRARQEGYHYALIASYFNINQGRIADVMKGRRFPEIPMGSELPSDFPRQ